MGRESTEKQITLGLIFELELDTQIAQISPAAELEKIPLTFQKGHCDGNSSHPTPPAVSGRESALDKASAALQGKEGIPHPPGTRPSSTHPGMPLKVLLQQHPPLAKPGLGRKPTACTCAKAGRWGLVGCEDASQTGLKREILIRFNHREPELPVHAWHVLAVIKHS